MTDGAFDSVRDGYDAVYAALEGSPTFQRLWRAEAYGADFPSDFAHIGFLTRPEATRISALLELGADDALVDVACGAGGPGLWLAQSSGSHLIGVDPSAHGLDLARARAAAVGLADRSEFRLGTFEHTGLAPGSADAVVSIEAFQYAPDKRAALNELRRVLRPGGVLAIVCFEVDPARVEGVPVLGVDPVADHGPLLEDAGFTVLTNEETPGWRSRVHGAFGALASAREDLVREMGAGAADSVLAEALVTLELDPYPRRVLVAGRAGH